MRAFITGIEGFVGKWLAGHLLEKGLSVSGSYFRKEDIGDLRGSVEPIFCDIRDYSQLLSALKTAQPDQIYHLAAQSAAGVSFEQPRLTFEVNTLGTLNLLEAVRELGTEPKILVVSSCQVYGGVESPVKEESPFNSLNPYASSKALAELIACQYQSHFSLKVLRVRPFNHTGPGQSPNFALSSFAKQMAEIEKGDREPLLSVGNLEVRRDFLDVRDVVKAYQLVVERGENDEVYNISTGSPHSLRDALDILLGCSEVKIEVRVAKERLRPTDISLLSGDPEKLFRATGWRPEISFEQTLRDLLQFWREQA